MARDVPFRNTATGVLPWQAVSYNANWADVGGGYVTFRYRRVGPSAVKIQGYPTRNTSASGANATIGSVAAGYIPTSTQVVGTFQNAGGTLGLNQVLISNFGQIVVSLSVAAGTALWVDTIYYLD